MKKLNLISVLLLLVFSCAKDNDDLIPQCTSPDNLSETDITFNSATLLWDDANSSASFDVEYGPTGFVIGSGSSISVTTNTVTITGLVANTTYDFYVQSICSVNNTSVVSGIRSFTTLAPPVVPEFRQNLSELNLYQGALSDLQPSIYTFEYELNTKLFTDYAHKQRLIALPSGEMLTNDGDGLPIFPDNTVIAKTFYYNIDDRDESLGKTIIETRILIKQNGVWVSGDYKWNAAQTEAILDPNGSTVAVSWIDTNGTTTNINYEIPSDADCFTCHQTNNAMTPIGPKLRTLNFEVNGMNQLQHMKNSQLLSGLTSPNDITVLPNWEDTNATLEQRARAYFDINCAHCHTAGGYCETQSILRLSYETSLTDSKIVERKFSITSRINSSTNNFRMPLIGTTIKHQEGVDLLQAYLDTL